MSRGPNLKLSCELRKKLGEMIHVRVVVAKNSNNVTVGHRVGILIGIVVLLILNLPFLNSYMIRFLLSVLITFSSWQLIGQVTFEEEPKVRQLMQRYEALGKDESHINGWRIKLVSTTNRRKLENTRYSFQRKYPELLSFQSHENPYYSLKVGAFETRYDLEPLLVRFKEDFPEAIPFRDRIMKTELFDLK